MADSSRERIIKVAHDLFYRGGFRGVGLDNILDEVGVSKTTFYNHFESKEELVMAVLKEHDRWWRDEFVRLLRKHGGDHPRNQLLAIPDVLLEMYCDEGYNGCFFVNVAVEFPLPHDPAHLAARDHKMAMEDILKQIAGYANCRDPGALAEELSLLMEGSYVTHQISRQTERTEVFRRMLNAIVAARVPKPRLPGRE